MLGTVAVHRAGMVTVPRRRRCRALLGMLALRPNEPVSRQWLTAGLWPTSAPRSAAANFRSHIAELRRILAGHTSGPRIVCAAGRYALLVHRDELDLLLFEDHATRGRHLLNAGTYPDAARELAAACALWRGPVLDGTTIPEPLTGVVRALEDRHLETIEDHVEARLGLGQHQELTVELTRLTTTHGFRERLWRQRMVALHRSGRRAEALAAHTELARLLATDLGVSPSDETQALYERLARTASGANAGASHQQPIPGP